MSRFKTPFCRVLLCSALLALTSCSSISLFPVGDEDKASSGSEKRNLKLLNPRPGRIQQLPDLQLIISPRVQKEINFYLKDKRSFRQGLANRKRYERMLNEVFKDEGVPASLINLAYVESQFNPTIRSPAGAVGMWQFMKETAKLYGLEVGYFEDQRTDPILSSIAAARHLYDLYMKFNDWLLAVAAYNGGVGAIENAMKKSGAKNFSELAHSGVLNAQSTRFVYRFLAVCTIMNDLEGYGFRVSGQKYGNSNRTRH